MGRTGNTVREGGTSKGNVSWFCRKVHSSNGTGGNRGMIERCPRITRRRLGTLVKGRMIGGDVVFMGDK